MILAIDTSTDQAGLAVVEDGTVLAEMEWRARGNHSRQAPPAIDQLFRFAARDLAATQLVAVAVGPGSFSGIRAGLSLAKGLSFGLGIPLAGVPTLDVLGYQGSALAGGVWAVLPAGRGQVYAARYQGRDSEWRRVQNYAVMTPEEIAARYAGELLIGEAAEDVARAVLDAAGTPTVPPPFDRVRRASVLAALADRAWISGNVGDPSGVEPLYLRRSAAEEKRLAERAQ